MYPHAFGSAWRRSAAAVVLVVVVAVDACTACSKVARALDASCLRVVYVLLGIPWTGSWSAWTLPPTITEAANVVVILIAKDG